MKLSLVAPALLGAATLLAGCVTAPATYDIQSSRTYAESKDVIWDRAVAYFFGKQITIRTIEKASGIIAADRTYTDVRTSADLDGVADCGTAPLAIAANVKADLTLLVRSLPDGKTSVSVKTSFEEARHFTDSPPAVNSCNSTGKLETTILDELGAPRAG